MGNLRSASSLLLIPIFLLGLVVNLYAADGLLNKGIAEYNAENYEESLETFKQVRASTPSSSEAAYYLGLAYKETGDFKSATAQFRDAVTLSPFIKAAFTELVEGLVNLGERKEANEWLAKADEMGIAPEMKGYLMGRVLLKDGKNAKAIETFNQAKGMDKSLDQKLDFFIAVAYSNMNMPDKARESIRAVIAVDPSSELASFADEYQSVIGQKELQKKKWKVKAGMGYIYDDNVVLNPLSDVAGVVTVTDKSDNGMYMTFDADFRHLLNDYWFYNAGFKASNRWYFNETNHNLLVSKISFMPGYTLQRGNLTLPMDYTFMLLHGKDYLRMYSVEPTLNIILSPGHIGKLSAGYANIDLLQDPLSSDDDRDANKYMLGAGYLHPFMEGKGMFQLDYEFSKEYTEGRNWNNRSNKFSSGVLLPVVNPVLHDVDFTASLDYMLQDYQNKHLLYAIERQDETFNGAAGFSIGLTESLNLDLRYSYTRADSNIPLYDYKRSTYTAGLEYSFN